MVGGGLGMVFIFWGEGGIVRVGGVDDSQVGGRFYDLHGGS